jgi:DNA-binding NarL/FixJ family response regulator
MMDAGAAGYLSKNDPKEKLISAIRRTAGGIAFFDAEQIERAQIWRETVNSKWESLTAKEHGVIKLMARGENNKAIAEYLSVSSRTVEFHVLHILKKLELPSRQKVMAWMHKNYPDELEDMEG